MSRVSTFLALSWHDRALLAEAVATLVALRLALHLWSIERLRLWADRRGTAIAPAERIVWALRTAAVRLPGVTCLSSALALQRMLSLRGYGSELHIGVNRQGDRLAAHAWLVRDGKVLIGEREAAEYTFLTAWPAGGSSG
ncbi:MAG: lasso peptide biosynthesis B2 protein [Proteobacteria bacterium]|nr:lasso peptide biosynthesis B2 protein [Pseudomonadota bacterium]